MLTVHYQSQWCRFTINHQITGWLQHQPILSMWLLPNLWESNTQHAYSIHSIRRTFYFEIRMLGDLPHNNISMLMGCWAIPSDKFRTLHQRVSWKDLLNRNYGICNFNDRIVCFYPVSFLLPQFNRTNEKKCINRMLHIGTSLWVLTGQPVVKWVNLKKRIECA